MCYSATASFVAGGGLTVVGLMTLRRTTNRAELPLAAIPLLFGVQQLVEGVIWLSFRYDAVLYSGHLYCAMLFRLPLDPAAWRTHTAYVCCDLLVLYGDSFFGLVLFCRYPEYNDLSFFQE